ncbi:MAG: MFS transporter, partial [Proteobacteria bacterium]|nr:MFS transporter [Pseudomonadota bacterium]
GRFGPTTWQVPAVTVGQQVKKKELVARGITNIFYPANIWIFGFFVLVIGVATGIGKAGVYKFIPEYFPQNVGAVGGMVGLLGAMGGFVLPPLFGWALEATGIWASCWIILAILSVVCLIWMQRVVSKILQSEAPELANLVDFRPRTRLTAAVSEANEETKTVEELLRKVPIFDNLGRAELTSLTAIGLYETAEAGRTLFREGDPGDTAYVILLGSIDVIRSDDEGHDVVIATLGAGEVFGELALIDGEPRSASAVAKVETQLFSIGRDDFIRLMSSSPRLLGDFMVGMTGRIRQTNAAFFEAMMQQERLRSEGEIERHRMIAQMVTGVAHEINTPIGIATHAASIITDDLRTDRIDALAKDDKARKQLADIAEAAQLVQDNIVRADRLIKSFRNLSVQQISESRETLDLAAYTEEVVGLYKMKAEAAHLELTTKLEVTGDRAQWEGYPGLYSQLILNIISNADVHAYPGNTPGKIDVTLAEAGDRFQLTIRDYGRGIPASDIENVWEPFFTTARDQGGTGLGLSIVRNIATTSLHGEIKLESIEGEGTTISIFIPKVVPAENDGAASSETAQ